MDPRVWAGRGRESDVSAAVLTRGEGATGARGGQRQCGCYVVCVAQCDVRWRPGRCGVFVIGSGVGVRGAGGAKGRGCPVGRDGWLRVWVGGAGRRLGALGWVDGAGERDDGGGGASRGFGGAVGVADDGIEPLEGAGAGDRGGDAEAFALDRGDGVEDGGDAVVGSPAGELRDGEGVVGGDGSEGHRRFDVVGEEGVEGGGPWVEEWFGEHGASVGGSRRGSRGGVWMCVRWRARAVRGWGRG